MARRTKKRAGLLKHGRRGTVAPGKKPRKPRPKKIKSPPQFESAVLPQIPISKIDWSAAAEVASVLKRISSNERGIKLERQVLFAGFWAWVVDPPPENPSIGRRVDDKVASEEFIRSSIIARIVIEKGIAERKRRREFGESKRIAAIKVLQDLEWKSFLRHFYFSLGGDTAAKRALSNDEFLAHLEKHKNPIKHVSALISVARFYVEGVLPGLERRNNTLYWAGADGKFRFTLDLISSVTSALMIERHGKTKAYKDDSIKNHWAQFHKAAALLHAADLIKLPSDDTILDRMLAGKLMFKDVKSELPAWLDYARYFSEEILPACDFIKKGTRKVLELPDCRSTQPQHSLLSAEEEEFLRSKFHASVIQ